MEKRVEQIVNHLVGTRLTYSSAVKPAEMGDRALFNAVICKIRVNVDTLRWEKYDVR